MKKQSTYSDKLKKAGLSQADNNLQLVRALK